MTKVSRYHDFSAGHRVVGHESKCRFLHGHNYRVHFECFADALDSVGRVIDFGDIKSKLCLWLEANWDHRLLLWEYDPWAKQLKKIDNNVVLVPFNPTAENMALYLLHDIAPKQLTGTGVKIKSITVEETRKCLARTEI